MVVERQGVAHKVADDVSAEVAGPLNDIVSDATSLMDDYIGHDDLRVRLQQIIDPFRADGVSFLRPYAPAPLDAGTEVDISQIEVGQAITVKWRGKPVFIRHRTPEEIKAAEDVDINTLRDPQPDDKRIQKPEWLIVVGVCTHLGCSPTLCAPRAPVRPARWCWICRSTCCSPL